MRWAFLVCTVILLVLVTGCLATGEGDIKEVEIEVRGEGLGGTFASDNTTVVKTGDGWETKYGESVPDECVRELKQHILKEEADIKCAKTEAEKRAEEREEKMREELEELENRIEEREERAVNLTGELEEAREKNQTDRVDRIQSNLDGVNQTIAELEAESRNTGCSYPGTRGYVVNLTYTNSTTVTIRSSMELDCGDRDHTWRVVEGGNITDEGKVTNPDRLTYLVGRIR